MKSNKLLNLILGCFILVAILIGTSSCKDDSNDWDVDSSYDKLFRALVFEKGVVNSNDISINFSKIIGAKKYIFEFSDDSLQFNNIIRTVEITADTLTPYSTSSVATSILFRKVFDELDADSKYSVRMVGVNPDKNISSEYMSFYFVTPTENLFKKPLTSADEVTLLWTPTDKVTRVEVYNLATGESVIADGAISESEKAAGEKIITGLQMGSSYVAYIYNGERKRGTIQFKTNGTAGSKAYEVQEGDDIAAVLGEFVSQGTYNVTLIFANEKTYDLATLAIPSGMNSVTFSASSAGTLPVLNLNKVSTLSLMDGLYFENLDIRGESSESSRFIDTNIEIQNVTFEGCSLSNYNCVTRFQNSAMSVEKVEMNNCIISNTGGYGVFNVGGVNVSFNELKITNSTFINIGTQLTDIRTAIKSINLSNCTFYNSTNKISQVFRFDASNLPLSVLVSNCIFSGANGGNKVNATYGNYTTLSLSFGGSYRTKDLVENKYKFTDITQYAGSAYELFTDPDNNVFSIKSSAGFAGEGVAGDPRWFN